jgi:hypothetical protein
MNLELKVNAEEDKATLSVDLPTILAWLQTILDNINKKQAEKNSEVLMLLRE